MKATQISSRGMYPSFLLQCQTHSGRQRQFLCRYRSFMASQHQHQHQYQNYLPRRQQILNGNVSSVQSSYRAAPVSVAGIQKHFFSTSSKDPKPQKPNWWEKPNPDGNPKGDSEKNQTGRRTDNVVTDNNVNTEADAGSISRKVNSSLLRRRGGQRRIFGENSNNNNKDENNAAVKNNNTINVTANAANAPRTGRNDIAAVNNAINQIMARHIPYPPEVVLVPHNERPMFPGINIEKYFQFPASQKGLYDALVEAKASDRPYVGLFKEKDLDEEEQNAVYSPSIEKESFHDIGVLAEIIDVRSEDEFAAMGEIPLYEHNSVPSNIQNTAEIETDFDSDSIENGFRVILKAHRRIRLQDVLEIGPPTKIKIAHIDEPDARKYDYEVLQAYAREIWQTIQNIMNLNPMGPVPFRAANVPYPGGIADFAAAALPHAQPADLQEVLSAVDLDKRLENALILLRKELQSGKVQSDINRKVDEKIGQNQRKYVLMEKLKEIKKELGMENDDKESYLSKFRQRVLELNEHGEGIPKEAQLVIDEELSKMETLEKNSAEFHMSRSYLEWLTCLPWSYFSTDNLDLQKASEILERDHYGLKDVKERILEFIAVAQLRGSVQGKILLLVGPPGVGKTSIGKSIAEALDRKFYRFSVGGLSDVSEIKGHRRTYVGAMPGKMVQCLKLTNVSNPLVLVDEIDKMGSGIRGDPASALLELLDPSQNTSFMDHYLDVPFDASKVLFVCTANTTDTIPGPLLDRMEVIRLSGYDLPEKVSIAQQYLEPRAKIDSGLVEASLPNSNENEENNLGEAGSGKTDENENNKNIKAIPSSLGLDKGAIESLARWYCREAGVRKLEQHIERIYRKLALQVLRADDEKLKDEDSWIIKADQLSEYVGQPAFTSDRLFDEPPPGVVMGLAWTAYGGSALYIESTNLKNATVTSTSDVENSSKRKIDSGFFVTGQLGDVMKESTRIALTHSKHKLQQVDPENNFFEVNQIHMHTPEGATPKDGPSAGVTMTTALLSLALNRTVSPDLAMTGELSLTGMVLPVGGIKEKVIASRRSGVKIVVLPHDNKKDVDELADYLKEDITFHFARKYDDVYRVAFPDVQ